MPVCKKCRQCLFFSLEKIWDLPIQQFNTPKREIPQQAPTSHNYMYIPKLLKLCIAQKITNSDSINYDVTLEI